MREESESFQKKNPNIPSSQSSHAFAFQRVHELAENCHLRLCNAGLCIWQGLVADLALVVWLDDIDNNECANRLAHCEAQPSVVRFLSAGGSTRSHMPPQRWEKVIGRVWQLLGCSRAENHGCRSGFWHGRTGRATRRTRIGPGSNCRRLNSLQPRRGDRSINALGHGVLRIESRRSSNMCSAAGCRT